METSLSSRQDTIISTSGVPSALSSQPHSLAQTSFQATSLKPPQMQASISHSNDQFLKLTETLRIANEHRRDLWNRVKYLETDLETTGQKFEKLLAQHLQPLTAKNEQLSGMVTDLAEENNNFAATMNDLMIENKRLAADRAELIKENNDLAASRAELIKENKTLNFTLTELTDHRRSSQTHILVDRDYLKLLERTEQIAKSIQNDERLTKEAADERDSVKAMFVSARSIKALPRPSDSSGKESKSSDPQQESNESHPIAKRPAPLTINDDDLVSPSSSQTSSSGSRTNSSSSKRKPIWLDETPKSNKIQRSQSLETVSFSNKS